MVCSRQLMPKRKASLAVPRWLWNYRYWLSCTKWWRWHGSLLEQQDFYHGSKPENIFLTIRQGRPYGMPSFGAVLAGEVIWDLPTNLSADPGMEWGTTVSPSTPKIEQTPAGGMATDTPWLYTQPFRPEAGGLSFIYLGVGITSAVLFSVTVWTMY